jgi:hypothetical protein
MSVNNLVKESLLPLFSQTVHLEILTLSSRHSLSLLFAV